LRQELHQGVLLAYEQRWWGGIESWLPFDLGQEQNICDIKVLLPVSDFCVS
jgi:hypothetical protein